MQKIFRLVSLPVVVLGLFASLFINLSLSSPAEALICPAGQVAVSRGFPVYKQCVTPSVRKPSEVPCNERYLLNDTRTILVDGECYTPASASLESGCLWAFDTLVRTPISDGSWGDREECLGTSDSQEALEYCAAYGEGWVTAIKDDAFVCMASVGYEEQAGRILQPPQTGTNNPTQNPTPNPANPANPANPDDGGATGATGTPVECNIDGVGWVVCPIMNRMADILDGAFNFISKQFLEIQTDLFAPPTDTYWGVFRNIANALFALAFVVVIASQVSNIGISNYGIKKLLPKLIIIAILVNLSFSLCKIAVDLSNIAGTASNDIFGSGLIQEKINPTAIQKGTGPNYLAGGVTIGVLGLAAGAGLYIAFPLLFSILLMGLLAVLSTVVILSAREMFVLLLVIVSPLAIASTILPNTQKLFDKWKSIFMGMLLVFPTIGIIWGASSATAQIMTSRTVNDPDDWLKQVLALAVMSVPLFATIPVVKGSLNALGKVGGILNDMGGKFKGGVDNWYKGSRAGKWGDYKQRERATNRALTQAGVVQHKGRGFNPRNWSAYGNKGVNRVSGQFGKDLASSGVYAADEGETKEVNQRIALLNSSYENGDDIGGAARDLKKFTASGDVIGARAAAQILAKGTGQSGKQKLRETMSEMQKDNILKSGSAVNSGLKKEIGRAGIKGDDAILDKFSVSQDGADKIEDIEKDASVHANLAIPALLNQRSGDIGLARVSGGLSKSTAQRILDSDEGNLLDAKRRVEVERAAMGDREKGEISPEEWEAKKSSYKPKRAE